MTGDGVDNTRAVLSSWLPHVLLGSRDYFEEVFGRLVSLQCGFVNLLRRLAGLYETA
jgi:hypothetical protein